MLNKYQQGNKRTNDSRKSLKNITIEILYSFYIVFGFTLLFLDTYLIVNKNKNIGIYIAFREGRNRFIVPKFQSVDIYNKH